MMILKRLPGLIFIIVFVVLISAKNGKAETWKITSLDWQPYSGSDMANQGESINKLRELLKKEGIELIVEFYPWARAQKIAQTKNYIGYFPAWPEEVKEGFIASLPVDWSYIGVMTYSGSNATWESIDKMFANFRVGIISTYAYPQDIAEAIKKYPHNTKSAPDELSLVKMLSSTSRFDVALTDPNVMLYFAKKNNIDNIQVLNQNIQKKELVISLRQGEDNIKRIELLQKILK